MTTGILDDYLLTWIESFLIDRKARGMTTNTILFYTRKLRQFADYCETQAVNRISQITADLLRRFILWLAETGHNPGGQAAAFRAVRAFLYWYEVETDEPTAIRKVKAPKPELDPLEGVSLETVMRMVGTCERGTFTGDRDAAILLALLDTGCRAREFAAVNLADVNQAAGDVLIRKSKSHKPRFVYLGRQSRRALRRYLKHRADDHPALWVTDDGDRLSYGGLRGIVTRRANDAGIDPPGLHDFRRGFALAMLRAGVDLYTLAKLMGHEGIDVLKRYVKLTDRDAAEAHRRASPVDGLEK